jgi:hypothetical protein
MPQDLKNLRSAFLDTFVRSLVINSYIPTEKEIEKQIKKTTSRIPFTPSSEAQSVKSTAPMQQSLPVHTHEAVPISPPRRPQRRVQFRNPPRQIPPRTTLTPLHTPSTQELPPMPKPRPIKNAQKTESINLGKVTQFLIDPSVMSVECPGPARNLLINRGGTIQTAPISLTKEEIGTIVGEVSETTRIPVTPGLFKAAFQDLVMTAVISEYVGSRFMIQKKTPFSNY